MKNGRIIINANYYSIYFQYQTNIVLILLDSNMLWRFIYFMKYVNVKYIRIIYQSFNNWICTLQQLIKFENNPVIMWKLGSFIFRWDFVARNSLFHKCNFTCRLFENQIKPQEIWRMVNIFQFRIRVVLVICWWHWGGIMSLNID
jgi:hypothetical protein